MEFRDNQGVANEFTCQVERNRSLLEMMNMEGEFYLEQVRRGKIINKMKFPNGVTTVAKNNILDAAFNAGTQTSTFYMSLIDGSNGSPGGLTPTLLAADTMASHTGFAEFVTYTEAVRQTWPKTAASAGVITGSTNCTFTMGTLGANIYIAGAFICTNNTKSGTSGILWATGLFAANAPAQTGDLFRLTYQTGLS